MHAGNKKEPDWSQGIQGQQNRACVHARAFAFRLCAGAFAFRPSVRPPARVKLTWRIAQSVCCHLPPFLAVVYAVMYARAWYPVVAH